jgi:flavodoxin
MVNNKKILIAYASGTESTEKLAQAIADGIKKVDGVSVDVKRAKDVAPDDAVSADGYAFGSHSASEYMEGELKILFEELYHVRAKVSCKPVLLFVTGHGGQVNVLEYMERAVGKFNPHWIKPDVAVEGMPGEADKAKAIGMGMKLAHGARKYEYIVA